MKKGITILYSPKPVKTVITTTTPGIRIADEKRFMGVNPLIGADLRMFDEYYRRRYAEPLRPIFDLQKPLSVENFQYSLEDLWSIIQEKLASDQPDEVRLGELLQQAPVSIANFILFQQAELKRLDDLNDFTYQLANIYQDLSTKLSFDDKFGMWTYRRMELFWEDISRSVEYPKLKRFGIFVFDLKSFKKINEKFTYAEANKIGQALGYYLRERIEKRRDISPEWLTNDEKRVASLLRFFMVKVMGDELVLVIPNLGSKKKLKILEQEILAALSDLFVLLITKKGKKCLVPIEFHYASKLLPKATSLPLEVHKLLNGSIHRSKLKSKVRCSKCGH